MFSFSIPLGVFEFLQIAKIILFMVFEPFHNHNLTHYYLHPYQDVPTLLIDKGLVTLP
jgi:hypothetical protein